MITNWALIDELKPFLQAAWKKSSFQAPTDIQQNAAPLMLAGKDIIAQSPTGTGKTLAYLLPVLNKIDAEQQVIQAIILASSHELVMQILEEIQKWGAESEIKAASFIGGANIKRQIEKLKQRPQLIVGTPGRIVELLSLKKLKLHNVKTIVLDEGDQLLVPEHVGNIDRILKATDTERQVVLFSATLNTNIEAVANGRMSEPEVIKIDRTKAPVHVEHLYVVCDEREKIDTLRKISRFDDIKALTFLNDIGKLTVLSEKLAYKGIKLGVLSSESKKQDRANAIKDLKAGKYPMLLATDVAARGLDVEGLTHVIHYDLPKEEAQYIHRSGRTGRLGSTSGTVISIVTEREERKLKQIARELKLTLKKKVFVKGIFVDGK